MTAHLAVEVVAVMGFRFVAMRRRPVAVHRMGRLRCIFAYVRFVEFVAQTQAQSVLVVKLVRQGIGDAPAVDVNIGETVAVEEITPGGVGVALAVLAVVAVADGGGVVELPEVCIVFEREISTLAVKLYEHLLRRVVWTQGNCRHGVWSLMTPASALTVLLKSALPQRVEFGDVSFGIQCVVANCGWRSLLMSS